MASPWLKGLSVVAIALLTSASLLVLPPSQAQAAVPSNDSSCLFIDSNHALVSGEFCTGDVVIPASVTSIKTNAFALFKGSVSFAANSQLQTVERLAFHGGRSVKSIIFPPSLTHVDDFAIVDTGQTLLYLEGNASAFGQNAVWQRNIGTTVVQNRNSAPLTQGLASLTHDAPFQVDCNTFSGSKDFVGVTFVALELHNCRNPRSPSDANPPSVFGYILNSEINELVTLQSLDGNHFGVIRLRQLGGSSMRYAAAADISAASFSISAFGDEFESPAQNSLTCRLSPGATLPAGVTLTNNCRFESTSTAALSSSTTDTTITWTAHPGATNAVDVAANSAGSTEDADIEGSASVRISLRKTADLSPPEYYQMLLLTAQFSGTARDWNLAIEAHRAIPSGAPAPDSGLVADSAVEAFEGGQASQTQAEGLVSTFADGLTAHSSFLTELRSRIALQAAKNVVAVFEATGGRAQAVRQQILSLPSSVTKTDLLARVNARTSSLLQRSSTLTGNIRTYVFSNPYVAEQLTIPAGVTQISIDVQGAEGSQGGDDRDGRPARAGFKGLVSGHLNVTAGQLITVAVGESGNDTPSECIPGKSLIVDDPLVAKGGTNPLGGYGGGSGGSPGVDSCVFSQDSGGGYGGAGGAASVVQIGDSNNPASNATIVAGGSAGSGGSTGAGPRLPGAIGLSTFTATSDQNSTNGQSGQAFNYFAVVDELDGFYEPFITGSAGGGGGGATGGIRGDWKYSTHGGCPTISFCFGGSSPGENSTSGLIGLTKSYVPYTFDAGMQSNGRVMISFVEPVVVPSTPNPAPNPAPNLTPGPDLNPTPTPGPAEMHRPNSPQRVTAVAGWKSAVVSWSKPDSDGGSPITGYQVQTPTGQQCSTTNEFSCKLTGLKPGQLLRVSVIAQNSSGASDRAALFGSKVFIPLSINLWQLKMRSGSLQAKLMNRLQLASLREMLSQDSKGFKLNLRLARNASNLSNATLKELLAIELRALKSQVLAYKVLGKVSITTVILPPNTGAKRPSVILTVRKP